jgi:flavin reductase (DIM6/NTAB) family NADH-FMN oxidoreductase RutF/uncharacterized protein YciI
MAIDFSLTPAQGETGAHCGKIPFTPQKEEWHPSVLPGPVVLISTVNQHEEPNIAPKSWISMVASHGPLLAFGCNRAHATARNAEAAGEFVVNLPSEALVERIWAMPASHGAERIRRSGLTLLPASMVRSPLIAECKAHLECTLEWIMGPDDEVVLCGRVVAASIDADCRESSLADQYFRLRPVFFLEDGVYGSLDVAKRVNAACPTAQALTVVEVHAPAADDDMLVHHLAYLRSLRESGVLVMAGSFNGRDEQGPTGMIVLAVPEAPARRIAEADPLIKAGARYVVRRWTRTH